MMTMQGDAGRIARAGSGGAGTPLRSGRWLAALLPIALPFVLAACGPQSPEDVRAASIAKCERQFARQAPDPAKGAALCSCVTDRLADSGLEITDMLGSNRAKVEGVLKCCAQSAGVGLGQ